MWYISANRDEEVFDDPFTFDMTRDPNPQIAFGGGGNHFCLGANLARMELKLIFQEIARRHARHAARGRARPPALELHRRHQAHAGHVDAGHARAAGVVGRQLSVAGGPRFTHLDDLKWQEVRRQQHGDRTVSVWEKWPEYSRQLPLGLRALRPGDDRAAARPHEPPSRVRDRGRPHVRRRALPGGHAHRARPGRHVRADRRRRRGVRAVRGDDGRPTVVPGADREEYEKFLADQGVVQLPNPPIEMPGGLEDLRNSSTPLRGGLVLAPALPARRPAGGRDRRRAARPGRASAPSTASTA